VNSTLQFFEFVGNLTNVGAEMGAALAERAEVMDFMEEFEEAFEDNISLLEANVELATEYLRLSEQRSVRNFHLRKARRALVALARPSEGMGFRGLKERCFRLELLSYFLPAGSKWRPVGLASTDSAVATLRLHASRP